MRGGQKKKRKTFKYIGVGSMVYNIGIDFKIYSSMCVNCSFY